MNQISDEATAHTHFAVACFNRAWELLKQESRTETETELMIHVSHASRYHWQQREDHSAKSASIAAWQLSRVYWAAGRPDEALRYGVESLDIARVGAVAPVFVGYGHEAVARAATALEDHEAASLHMDAARELLDTIPDTGDRAALLADLDTVG